MTTTYTSDQERITLSVLSKDKHAFYDILSVERTADDSDIKKAYRKLAIKLHPDKNPHPRSSEAFKIINRAFEVLGDIEKRKLYDTLGRDPDDRNMPTGGASASGFGNSFPMSSGGTPFENMFFQRGGGAAVPEDLFDILFGGMGGSPFGGSPFGGNPFMNNGAAFGFGGPQGFRVYTNGRGRPFGSSHRTSGRPRSQHGQQQRPESELSNTFKIILPIVILLALQMIEKWLIG